MLLYEAISGLIYTQLTGILWNFVNLERILSSDTTSEKAYGNFYLGEPVSFKLTACKEKYVKKILSDVW